MRIVVKIGTSSLTDGSGALQESSIDKLCDEVAEVRHGGHDIVIVTSAAISAGLPELGFSGVRPRDTVTLQAAAAVGQSRLLRAYDRALGTHGLVGGQILLSPENFFDRKQYLHARETLGRLLQLGIVPIVNENDAVASDEIRFGDNDRIAALVAHALAADMLVLLTDTPGLYTADPRLDAAASLVEEVREIDQELERAAGGAGTARGSGGMASKLGAARMAAWSGVRTVIAAAARRDVLIDAVSGEPGVGTLVHARDRRLGARKLWIAFAMPSSGRIVVDDGARTAVVDKGSSLLAAGVRSVEGDFDVDAGVEVVDASGEVFAKGLSRYSAAGLRENAGLTSAQLGAGTPAEVIHRDDMVVLA